MQGVVLQAKKLSKSVYIFSADAASGKVAHVNAVSEVAKAKGVDAREWATAVVEILGGKVSRLRFCLRIVGSARSRGGSSLTLQAGGKPDGAQGVGTETRKVQEALEVARKFFETKMAS